MTHEITRPRASWTTALRAQFLLLWHSRRPLVGFGIVVLIWGVFEYTATRPHLQFWAKVGPKLVLNPGWLVVTGLIGCFWGIATWREQNRQTRPFHWIMPVDVTAHDLARIAAGACWLVLTVLFALATTLTLALVHGHGAAVLGVSPLYWLAYFGTALICFLLIVALATLSGRPLEIVMLGLVTFYGIAGLLAIAGQDTVAWQAFERTMTTIFNGRYGMIVAFHGTGAGAAEWDRSLTFPRGYAATWATATLLWLAIGGTAVGAALVWVRRRLAQ